MLEAFVLLDGHKFDLNVYWKEFTLAGIFVRLDGIVYVDLLEM